MASMYLSPGSATLSQGETLSIQVRENSGEEPVNGVQANLSYPANLLDLITIDTSGSSFGIEAQNQGADGVIKIGRATISPVKGDQSVATITFKAKTNDAVAAVSFTEGSQITSSNTFTNIMTSSNGGNYTLKAAPPTPKPVEPPPKPIIAPVVPATPPVEPKATSSVASANKKVSISITTPNTRREKTQSSVGFWVPLIVLVTTLAVSTLVTKGYNTRGIRRHFLFLFPHKFKKYHHI